MRRLEKIILGRDAVTLVHEREVAERFALANEAGEPRLFAYPLLFDERLHRFRSLLSGGQKAAGLDPVWSSMIEARFDDWRGRFSALAQQRTGSMDSKGACVVVGMATFVGVGEDDFRPLLGQKLFEPVSKPGQTEACFLIGNAEPFAAGVPQPGQCQHAA